jgi:membrane-bound lytic murein transglycosylase B
VTRLAACAAFVWALSAGGAGILAARQTPPATFEVFVEGVRSEARQRGITDTTVTRALDGLTPEPVVVARDRAQPELTQSLDQYIAARLTPKVLATARTAAAERRSLLASVQKTYGVAPPIMIAIWGLESNFGRFTGTYSTIRSLATLAYDARRPIFRDELFNALTIIDRGAADPADLKGSWAGAMGQPQFMPSSFLKYAVDFDRDGRPNIWTSEPDVFASMANFLREKGWTAGERWGREVSVPRAAMAKIDRQVAMRQSGCRALREMTTALPLSDWKRLGVRLPGGRPLPDSTMDASLVRGRARHFLAYRNYGALLEYNCSNAYAVSLGLLSDRIAGAAGR